MSLRPLLREDAVVGARNDGERHPSHPVTWSPRWSGDETHGDISLTERTSPAIACAQDRTSSPDLGADWRHAGGQKPGM